MNLKAYGYILFVCLSMLKYASGQNDTMSVYRVFEKAEAIYTDYPDSTISMITKALKKARKINYVNGISESYGWLAYLYQFKGNYDRALEFYDKAIRYDRASKLEEALATDLINLGTLLSDLGADQEAIKLYRESFSLYQKIGDSSMVPHVLNNIGVYHSDHGNYDSAVIYLKKSLNYSALREDLDGYVNTLDNLGFVHNMLNQQEEATIYMREAIYYCKTGKVGLKSVAQSYSTYADFLLENNQVDSAIYYGEIALDIARQTQSDFVKSFALKSLFPAYAKLGKWEISYRLLDSFLAVDTRLKSEKSAQEAISQSFRWELDKRMLADSISDLNRDRIKAAEHEAEIQHERNMQVWMIGAIAIALFVIFSLYLLNRSRRKANTLISQQRDQLKEKNEDIMDSIQYAQRLQKAILPTTEKISDFFEDCFVLYKPKDIVSGDFYWAEKVGNTLYIACADCTGHGVPGALVSVACSYALSQSLIEENRQLPSHILDRTRELIIERFSKGGGDIRDGMDVGLCAIRYKENVVHVDYAGANRPLWAFKKEEEEMIEFSSDRQPVGDYEGATPFRNKEIKMLRGDALYLFSDGAPDQFGGSKSKKLKIKAFRSWIIDANKLEKMDKQGEFLEQKLAEWMGDLEQLDDISVIGLRL